jgi:hypothetical protein
MKRDKDKRFEREAAKVLSRITGRSIKRCPIGNYREIDLLGLYGFSIEVRVAEKVTQEVVERWWQQTICKREEAYFSPMLMYRQHRGKWRCRWRGLHGHWLEGTPEAWWNNDMHRHLLFWT